jgi:SAM-dependent methyltransferase
MPGANHDQQQFWNSTPGRKWADHQQGLDRLFQGVLDLAVDSAAPVAGERVLDIGCGTGASTMALARQVAPGGSVLGLDISDPLLAFARERAAGAPGVTFLLADAQTASLPVGNDLLFSRFGVMFFDDPVAAFRNMGAALRPGGRVVLAAWASREKNPWTSLTAEAGTRLVGAPPDEPPGRPGQFAFADIARVTDLLAQAGLVDVSGAEHPVDLEVEGDARDAAALATSIGPVARILQHHGRGEDARQAIAQAVARDFAPFESDGAVRVPARVNLFTARVP